MFSIVDATKWRVDEVDEQLGTKEKSWLLSPGDERWLFKEVRTTGSGHPGEDWAEKLVEQLGLHLGLPVARIDLAQRNGARGIISHNFVPDSSRLEHGNELLVRIDPEYDRDQTRRNARYTVDAVRLALEDAYPPDSYLIEGLSAFDLWAGYLVLDAWVAGRDRHHENWGVIASPNRRILAPSIDHGNALGFQESDQRHGDLAADEMLLSSWAERGRSHHFAGRPSLVDLARQALDLASPAASDIWLSKLADVSEDEVASLVDQVPAALMSEGSRTFCLRLLSLNQRRLCDVS